MDLAAFQKIYFWEWLHRLLGRLIGLAFAFPLGSPFAGRSRAATTGGSSLFSRSAGFRARSAGTWSSRAWWTAPTSAISASPRICSAFLLLGGLVWTALDLRQRPARPGPLRPPSLIVPHHACRSSYSSAPGSPVSTPPVRRHMAAGERPAGPRRDRLVERRRLRIDSRPVSDPLSPSLVGARHAGRAGHLRAQRPALSIVAALAIDIALAVQILLGIATVVAA